MVAKEAMLIICKCGRIKKWGEWVKVKMGFSDFLALSFKLNVYSFAMPIEECNFCREKREENLKEIKLVSALREELKNFN